MVLQVTAAGYSYYCTLLPSLWCWPQLLRVALPLVLTVRLLVFTLNLPPVPSTTYE